MGRKTIVLSEETYQRLRQFKLELIREKGDPGISFDEVVRELLNRVGGKRR